MHTTRFATAAAASLILLFTSLSSFAHGPDAHREATRVIDALEHTPDAPAAAAPIERLTGEIRHVTIADRVTGLTVEHYALKLDDGTAVGLKNVLRTDLVNGDRVEATGRRNGQLLFSSAIRTLRNAIDATNQKAKSASVNGTLALLHSDDFDSGRSDFVFEVHDKSGAKRRLDFGVPPEALQAGMAVHVSGVTSADGVTLVPTVVAIDALPVQDVEKDFAKAVRTNNVLVILMTFTDSGAQPFTQAQVQSTVGGGPGSGSVAEYFKEASFGQQLMNVTVTPWLATGAATPANCDWQTMGTLGRNAATAAGYTVGNYQNLVYVFPAVGACGWTGLGYIGASGVWINGRNLTSVYGHELGHNFGLLHAGSLRCTGAVIGGACSVSEYGDPFDTMGNQSAMHYNAMQKLALGWIASGTVQTHTTGTRTYVLSPLETGGASAYAVKIPAASNRTYWLEFRQPIGFDAGLASYPNNGAQVRVASPFETLCSGCNSWSNDTQLLDMTPATGAFTDAALTVGNTFTDSTYNVTISVVSASSTSLTLTVTTPGAVTATSTSVSSSSNPANTGTSVTFTATVTGTTPTGSVSFTADGAALCNAMTLSGSGNAKTATCATSTLAAGTHSIVASYAGDAANGVSSSAPLSEVISGGAANLVNSSFEVPALGSGYQYAPSGSGIGWIFSGGSGIQANGSAWGSAPAPNGTQTAFIQNVGTISQTVTLNAGSYTLTFQAARRASQLQPIQISVDGGQVGSLISPATSSFTTFTVPFSINTTGTHTIRFAGTDNSGDKSTFIDAVSITAVPSSIALVNPSFEVPGLGSSYQYAPTASGIGWTFSGGGGIQGNGSAWGSAPAPDGTQTAYIQNVGTISQTINLNAGSYTLTFQAARRASQLQPIQVSVDGTQVGSLISPATSSFTTFTVPFSITATGTHTVRFAGTDNSGDKSTFIDAVSINAVPSSIALVNPSFETPALGSGYQYAPTASGIGWTFSGGGGIQGNGSAWGSAPAPDGTQTAFIQNVGTISQTINLNAGSYTLTFQAARRAGQLQPIQVSLDGTQLGSLISPSTSSFTTFTVPFTITTTGAHTIRFAGTDNSGDKSTFIDGVTIGP